MAPLPGVELPVTARSDDERKKLAEAAAEGEAETLAQSSAPTVASDPLAPSPGPGAPLAAVGQVVGGRYRVEALLGRGGMGEVWRAWDLKLRMDVALKSLHPSLGEGEAVLELLRGEVRAARVVVSPNVCRLYDLVEVEGVELVSMEYIDGQTLLDLLAERGPLALDEAREIGSQFLAGLEAIHQAGLVHRDIKPENIMRTRAGRVVIMDFGLTAPSGTGDLSGTPAYMAPEQARGEATDARADVFSAGMVLAEMLSAEPGERTTSRQTFWKNVRKDPPELPDTAWTGLLSKAVEVDREERYASAAELARRLEEVTVRVEGAETAQPYPGLASFSEEAAEFFFGREAEVEAVWKKLQQAYLLGLVGASGSGKSSFVNAGLLPARPEGWAHVEVKPGRAPFAAVAQAMRAELGGEGAGASGNELEDTLTLLGRWRSRHEEALLVVDQFEELFTLNPIEVQERFAELLARAAFELDVRVLVSIRDDFLLRCHDFEALDPLFSELTPLKPPMGSALRRALTQPALRLGYRFEDEAMVDEMLAEVTRERGALPLIAFTAARLWEERDPEEGLLTRAAYERMGGVGGALAQHAETTLEAVGNKRTPIVRELFRNLVTAQNTRAVPEIEELLSVFAGEGGEREIETAREVLQALVDARLLTSYEVPGRDGEAPRRHVELVHESLLTAWPRLVRWQTQDAEGTQLRDELRQAAKLWDTRGRPEDLLWSGTAFREFELWRARYPGRLTALEEAYAQQMVRVAERKRRRRRIAVAAGLVLAVTVAAIMGLLWRRSETARTEAVASELLALARVEEERYPTGALAYATRSLEIVDSVAARELAIKNLWRAPPARIQQLGENSIHLFVDASPDGRWVVSANAITGEITLLSRDGEPRPLFTHPNGMLTIPAFAPAGDLVVLRAPWDPEVRVLSVPEGELVRTFQPGPAAPDGVTSLVWAEVRGDAILTFTTDGTDQGALLQSWPLAGGEPRQLGRWPGFDLEGTWSVDPTGSWVVTADPGGRTLERVALEGFDLTKAEVLGTHDEEIASVTLSPAGEHLALTDRTGRVVLWSLAGDEARPIREFETATQDGMFQPLFDPSGAWLAWGSQAANSIYLWDLDGALSALPTALRVPTVMIRTGAFDPLGRFLVTAHDSYLAFWSLDGNWARKFPPTGLVLWGPLSFTPEAGRLASSHIDGLRVWPLEPGFGPQRKLEGFESTWFLAAHPGRPELLAAQRGRGPLTLLSLEDGARREILASTQSQIGPIAFDRDGSRAAMATRQRIRVWTLATGEVQEIPFKEETLTESLAFLPDGRLLSAGAGGVRAWDLQSGEHELFFESEIAHFALSADDQHLAVIGGDYVDQYIRNAKLFWFDLGSGEAREITTHGEDLLFATFDPSGRVLVTTDGEGVTRVGPVTGEEPHLLLGHQVGGATHPAISPDGRWIFSGGGPEIRQWPMPDLSRPPLHTLPREELLTALRSLSNLRVIEDEASSTGYAWAYGPVTWTAGSR